VRATTVERSFAVLAVAAAMGLHVAGAAQSGSASISGVVVDENGRAIPRATVAVSVTRTSARAVDSQPFRQVTADESGRFAIDGLTAGEFAVIGSRAGYVDARLNPQAIPIVRLSGAGRVTVTIRLQAGAVISGIVLDRDGTPAAGVRVRLDSRFNQLGKAVSLRSPRVAETNSRGEYRLYGVAPGSYVVAAVPDLAFTGALSIGDQRAVAYVPMYFPNEVSRAGAGPVSVIAGEERSGVDFRLRTVDVSSMTVRIETPAGQSIDRGHGDCDAAWTDREAETQPFAELVLEGGAARLSCPSLTTGPHTIAVVATPNVPGSTVEPPLLWGTADLFATGKPLEISVTLQPGEPVPGRAVLEPAGDRSPTLPAFSISLEPAAGPFRSLMEREVLRVSPDARGEFRFPSVPAGRYRLDADGPPGWSLVTATVDGRDVLDLPFDVTAPWTSDVRVVFSRATSTIAGRVRSADGAVRPNEPVIVFPADERYWIPESRRIRLTRTDLAGRYEFQGLPAGPYLIALDSSGLTDEAWDLTVLVQLSPSARRIVLGTGQTVEVELRPSAGDFGTYIGYR
jgi:protocatechuate 3,4-dioxygenase beta subunit